MMRAEGGDDTSRQHEEQQQADFTMFLSLDNNGRNDNGPIAYPPFDDNDAKHEASSTSRQRGGDSDEKKEEEAHFDSEQDEELSEDLQEEFNSSNNGYESFPDQSDYEEEMTLLFLKDDEEEEDDEYPHSSEKYESKDWHLLESSLDNGTDRSDETANFLIRQALLEQEQQQQFYYESDDSQIENDYDSKNYDDEDSMEEIVFDQSTCCSSELILLNDEDASTLASASSSKYNNNNSNGSIENNKNNLPSSWLDHHHNINNNSSIMLTLDNKNINREDEGEGNYEKEMMMILSTPNSKHIVNNNYNGTDYHHQECCHDHHQDCEENHNQLQQQDECEEEYYNGPISITPHPFRPSPFDGEEEEEEEERDYFEQYYHQHDNSAVDCSIEEQQQQQHRPTENQAEQDENIVEILKEQERENEQEQEPAMMDTNQLQTPDTSFAQNNIRDNEDELRQRSTIATQTTVATTPDDEITTTSSQNRLSAHGEESDDEDQTAHLYVWTNQNDSRTSSPLRAKNTMPDQQPQKQKQQQRSFLRGSSSSSSSSDASSSLTNAQQKQKQQQLQDNGSWNSSLDSVGSLLDNETHRMQEDDEYESYQSAKQYLATMTRALEAESKKRAAKSKTSNNTPARPSQKNYTSSSPSSLSSLSSANSLSPKNNRQAGSSKTWTMGAQSLLLNADNARFSPRHGEGRLSPLPHTQQFHIRQQQPLSLLIPPLTNKNDNNNKTNAHNYQNQLYQRTDDDDDSDGEENQQPVTSSTVGNVSTCSTEEEPLESAVRGNLLQHGNFTREEMEEMMLMMDDQTTSSAYTDHTASSALTDYNYTTDDQTYSNHSSNSEEEDEESDDDDATNGSMSCFSSSTANSSLHHGRNVMDPSMSLLSTTSNPVLLTPVEEDVSEHRTALLGTQEKKEDGGEKEEEELLFLTKENINTHTCERGHLDETSPLDALTEKQKVDKSVFFAILKIQALVRGFLTRRRFAAPLHASELNESPLVTRDGKSALGVEDLNLLVGIVQAHVRGFLVRRCRAHLLDFGGQKDENKGGSLAASRETLREDDESRPAISIQSLVRGYLVRKRKSRNSRKVENETVRPVQHSSSKPAFKTPPRPHMSVMSKNSAARLAQRAFDKRVAQARQLQEKKKKAAYTIQYSIICYVARTKLLRKKQLRDNAAMIVFKFVFHHHNRRVLVKKARQRRRQVNAIVGVLQVRYRAFCIREIKLRSRNRAATSIQSFARMHYAMSRFRTAVAFVITIQSVFRMFLAKQLAGDLHLAASIIQGGLLHHFRKLRSRRLQIAAAVVLQRSVRRYHDGCVLRRKKSPWLQRQRDAARIARRAEQNAAILRSATFLQGWYRTRSCFRTFQHVRNAAIIIQRAERRRRSSVVAEGQSCVTTPSLSRGKDVVPPGHVAPEQYPFDPKPSPAQSIRVNLFSPHANEFDSPISAAPETPRSLVSKNEEGLEKKRSWLTQKWALALSSVISAATLVAMKTDSDQVTPSILAKSWKPTTPPADEKKQQTENYVALDKSKPLAGFYPQWAFSTPTPTASHSTKHAQPHKKSGIPPPKRFSVSSEEVQTENTWNGTSALLLPSKQAAPGEGRKVHTKQSLKMDFQSKLDTRSSYEEEWKWLPTKQPSTKEEAALSPSRTTVTKKDASSYEDEWKWLFSNRSEPNHTYQTCEDKDSGKTAMSKKTTNHFHAPAVYEQEWKWIANSIRN